MQAQIAGALPAVQAQVAQAQRQVAQSAGRVGSVILPPGVRSVTPELERAAVATQNLGRASRKAASDTVKLSAANRGVKDSGVALSHSIQTAERDIGRYTRGVAAASLASTGFFRAVSFASGAFLIGAAVGGTIGAAVAEFKQMTVVGAQTAAIIKATGGAANVTAGQIDALSKRTLSLTGIDDEQVKSAANILLTFRGIRNETGKMNDVFTRATKAVVDISSVFKTDLRGSAVQLGKALQDPIRGVTALRRSGITLSQAQRDLIKNLVETGRTFTAQKLILSEVEKQVGGTAEAIGRTLPGRLAILREQAKNSLGEFVKRLSESRQAVQIFDSSTSGIGQGFRTAAAIITTSAKAIGAPFKVLNEAFPQLAEALSAISGRLGGLKELVKVATTAAVVFGTLKVALLAASFAQGIYARATGSAIAAALAQTAAETELAVAAGTATVAQLAAARAAAATAAANSALGASLLRGLTNPLLLVTAGLTAAAIGIIKLRQAAANAPGTINAVRHSLDALGDTVERGAKLQSALAGKREDVTLARLDVQGTQKTVDQAQARLTTSGASPGSIAQLGLEAELAAAEKKHTDAVTALNAAERTRDLAEAQYAHNQQSRQTIIDETTKKFQDQIAAMREGSSTFSIFGHNIDTAGTRMLGLSRRAQNSAAAFQHLSDQVAASGNRTKRILGETLGALSRIGQTPDQKKISVIVDLVGRGLTRTQIFEILGIESGAEDIRLRGIATATPPGQQAEDEFLAQKAILATLIKKRNAARDVLKTQQETVRATLDERDAAREALASAVEGLANARRSLADAIKAVADAVVTANRNIADAIKGAKQATNDAIASAKTNLDSLGQSLADLLNTASKELGGSLGTGKLGPAFQRLREQILAGGGGPETQLAAQRIQSRLSAAPNVDTDKLAKAFALLTDNLNSNLISLKQFRTGVTNLFKGVDLTALKKIDPLLARQIQRVQGAIGQQAGNIARAPRRAGGGQEPTVVAIAATIRQGAQSIVDARNQAADDIKAANRAVKDASKSVAGAEHDVAQAQHRLADAMDKLRTEQSRETKLNTKAVLLNTKAVAQFTKTFHPDSSQKPKAKPKGDAASRAGDLTNSGAASP